MENKEKDLGVALDALDEKIDLLGIEIAVIAEKIEDLKFRAEKLQENWNK